MQMNRRSFLETLAGAAAVTGAGAAFGADKKGAGKLGRPAVQLYSIREYIAGKKDGSLKGVGLAKALADVKRIGYEAVEFAGYYGHTAKELKQMLGDNGLVACGTHVSRDVFAPDVIQKTIDFNLEYGNTHLICPGGGMWPPKGWAEGYDGWWKKMVEFYAQAANTANARGCTLGYHNHTDEFVARTAMKDGTLMWEYFFANTPKNVCMELDVGWCVCAGQDPCYWFKRFPGRSPTLHAKENGGYLTPKPEQKRSFAPHFEAILGKPGKFDDGKTVTPVDWDKLFPVTDACGVKWYVVECERNAANLTAITESYKFLKGKGRC